MFAILILASIFYVHGFHFFYNQFWSTFKAMLSNDQVLIAWLQKVLWGFQTHWDWRCSGCYQLNLRQKLWARFARSTPTALLNWVFAWKELSPCHGSVLCGHVCVWGGVGRTNVRVCICVFVCLCDWQVFLRPCQLSHALNNLFDWSGPARGSVDHGVRKYGFLRIHRNNWSDILPC